MINIKIPASPVQKRGLWPPKNYHSVHKVNDSDDWLSIATKYGVSVSALIEFNFGTLMPEEINWYLKELVGCRLTGPKGYNYSFRGADPTKGKIYIPKVGTIPEKDKKEKVPIPLFALHFRRYAPFKTFGVPSFEGDTRKTASTSLQATSRTHGAVLFNQLGILNQIGRSSGTRDANLVLTFLDRKAMATVSISATRSDIAGPGLLGFTAKTAGSNPLVPLSPDIDTRVKITMEWGSGMMMRIRGKVAGDDFPNLEVFIHCYGSKKSALLVDGRTDRGGRTGPFSLPGSGGHLCSFNASIPLNNQGHFISNRTCSPIKI